jgi:hypothetical protein
MCCLLIGLIDEETINVSVKRMFRARMRLGMFDPPEMVTSIAQTHTYIELSRDHTVIQSIIHNIHPSIFSVSEYF